MKKVKLMFLVIICSQIHIIHCDFLSGMFSGVQPQNNDQPVKLNRKKIFSVKKKNDESHNSFTAFPPPPPTSKNEGGGLDFSDTLLRRKRAQEIVIGRRKTFENSTTVYINVGKTVERDNHNAKNKNEDLQQDSATDSKELKNRRLIHGNDATMEEYPYVVSIQRNHEHWCSGAIIHPSIVITTANCVWKLKSSSKMTVRVGSRRTESGGYVVGIKTVIKHPDWSVQKDPDCDIALLKLNTSIRFSDGLHALELPNKDMMPPFDDVWVTSWGTERPDVCYDVLISLPLQVYHAQLLPREKCNNVTSRFTVNVTDTFICVAQTDGKVARCGTMRSPAMFSYVAAPRILDFITRASSELMSEEPSNLYVMHE